MAELENAYGSKDLCAMMEQVEKDWAAIQELEQGAPVGVTYASLIATQFTQLKRTRQSIQDEVDKLNRHLDTVRDCGIISSHHQKFLEVMAEYPALQQETLQLMNIADVYNTIQAAMTTSFASLVKERVKGLEKDLLRVDTWLAELRTTLQIGVREICDSPPCRKCPVCLDREIDTCIAPCGHTLCDPCLKSIVRQSRKLCPVCRGLITTPVKLYWT